MDSDSDDLSNDGHELALVNKGIMSLKGINLSCSVFVCELADLYDAF